MSIGPFGFTAAGIAQLGNQADTVIPRDFLGSPQAADVVRVVSVLVALWLWGLSMWFFLVSVGSMWKYVRAGSSMPFQMTWWSFVFPNTALVRYLPSVSVSDTDGVCSRSPPQKSWARYSTAGDYRSPAPS